MTTLKQAAAVLALAGSILAASVVGAQAQPKQDCYYIDVPNTPKLTVQELMAHGYYPDPTDHAERLYSPGCRV